MQSTSSEEVPLLPASEQTTEPIEERSVLKTSTAVCYIISIFGVVPIVALPGAITYCGITGFLLVAILLVIETYTAVLLGRTWICLETFWPEMAKNNQKYPYSAIADQVGGLTFRRVVNVFQMMAILGDSVVFLLLAAESLQRVTYGLSAGDIEIPFCYCLIITAAIVMPFLCMGTPKDLWHVIWIGAGSVILISICVLITLILDAPKTYDPPPETPSWVAIVYCFGAFAFQFDIHPMILTVQMDMKKRESLPLALVIAFAVAFVAFGTISTTSYLMYGKSIHPNVLNNFEDGPLLFSILIIVSFQSLICLALGINTLFQDLEESVGIPDKLCWRRIVVRTLVTLFVLFIAQSIPHFATALELVGGLLVTPFIFIFPPIFYISIKRQTSGVLDIKEVILSIHIIIIGIVGCISSTIESGYQISLLPSFAPPCYIDFQKASEMLPDQL